MGGLSTVPRIEYRTRPRVPYAYRTRCCTPPRARHVALRARDARKAYPVTHSPFSSSRCTSPGAHSTREDEYRPLAASPLDHPLERLHDGGRRRARACTPEVATLPYTSTLPPSSPHVRRAISDVFPLLERVRNGRHRRNKRHEQQPRRPFSARSGRSPAAGSLLQGHQARRACNSHHREREEKERTWMERIAE